MAHPGSTRVRHRVEQVTIGRMTQTASSPEQPDLTVDVVVIGGGPVGENVVDRAGRTGLNVALVEAELIGGECSYWACIPSKTLLRPGAVVAAAAAVPGVEVSDRIDPQAVFARRDAMVADWDDSGQQSWLEGIGVTLLRGTGRLVGERLVEVTPSTPDGERDPSAAGVASTLVRARHAVVLATGSEPRFPHIPGLAEVSPWTSREATSADEVPKSLAVIGGGVVAVEMAVAYADLGSEVTVLSRGGLLSRAEPWASEAVAGGLRAAGVNLHLHAVIERVARDADGVHIFLANGASVDAAEVLVATGRVPATARLGLTAVGLDPEAPLAVDAELRVRSVDGGWLYAAGDVAGRAATTHQGKYEARVVGDVIAARYGRPDSGATAVPTSDELLPADGSPAPWSRYRATADEQAAPQVVFARPEVASVGHTEQSARDAGLAVRVLRTDLGAVSGGYLRGDGYAGCAQLVVDTDRDVVVGATFVGPDVAEMLHAATVAVVGEVPLRRLWHAVPAFPTVSEAWLRLLEDAGL